MYHYMYRPHEVNFNGKVHCKPQPVAVLESSLIVQEKSKVLTEGLHGCYRQVAATDRWLLQTGGCCRQVAAVDRWLLQTGGCCRQVTALNR